MRTRLSKNERGAALVEAAVTIPLILLISVGIFEFGRAFQTWQVLTNAAREGARVAILAGTSQEQVKTVVVNYMNVGNICDPNAGAGECIPNAGANFVTVDQAVPFGDTTASQVTINYPFEFWVLNPVVRLVNPTATVGGAPITMSAVAVMRNE